MTALAADAFTAIGSDTLKDTLAERTVSISVPRGQHDADPHIEIRQIDVGGQVLNVAIRFIDEADTDRPPLLMFNGIGANLEVGFPFMSCLKNTNSIIFDVPGIGGSPMPSLPYRPRSLARMARRVLEIYGFDQADISGVSWGGGLAQQFAYQYPKICRRLVLVATAPGWTMVPGSPSVLSKMANVRRYVDPDYMREIAAEIYGGDFRKDREKIAPHIRAMRPASNAGYTLQLLAMAGWTSIHWLWRLRCKTLVMAGTDDPLIPVVNARMLAKLIPDAKLQLVENGHLFIVTQPQSSAKTVEDFLNE